MISTFGITHFFFTTNQPPIKSYKIDLFLSKTQSAHTSAIILRNIFYSLILHYIHEHLRYLNYEASSRDHQALLIIPALSFLF